MCKWVYQFMRQLWLQKQVRDMIFCSMKIHTHKKLFSHITKVRIYILGKNGNGEMTELYANTLLLANNHQARNTIQQHIGCNLTLRMKWEVLFTFLRTVHAIMVRCMILVRNGSFDPTLKIVKLTAALRGICLSQQSSTDPDTKSSIPVSKPREE